MSLLFLYQLESHSDPISFFSCQSKTKQQKTKLHAKTTCISPELRPGYLGNIGGNGGDHTGGSKSFHLEMSSMTHVSPFELCGI